MLRATLLLAAFILPAAADGQAPPGPLDSSWDEIAAATGSDADLAAAIARSFQAAGAEPVAAAQGFGPGYLRPFPWGRAQAGQPAVVRLHRASGVSAFPGRPFPFPASESLIESSGEALLVEPEDLAWLGSYPPPTISSRFEGSVIVTVERPADDQSAALLAEMAQGASRLGAAGLVILRAADGPSVYEDVLSAAAGQVEAMLPWTGPVPDLLAVSTGRDLAEELLGRHAFARLATPPARVGPTSRFSPYLLDLAISIESSLERTRVQGVNVVALLEGSDSKRRGEVVLVLALREPARLASLALLAGIARQARSPQNRPERTLMLAAVDASGAGRAGTLALAAFLDEAKATVSAALEIDLGAAGEGAELAMATEGDSFGLRSIRLDASAGGLLSPWQRREAASFALTSSGPADQPADRAFLGRAAQTAAQIVKALGGRQEKEEEVPAAAAKPKAGG